MTTMSPEKKKLIVGNLLKAMTAAVGTDDFDFDDDSGTGQSGHFTDETLQPKFEKSSWDKLQYSRERVEECDLDHSGDIWVAHITENDFRPSEEYLSSIIDALKECGIEAKANKYTNNFVPFKEPKERICLSIDFAQPNFEQHVAAFMQKHKEHIIRNEEGDLKHLDMYGTPTPAEELLSYVPRLPDGKALNPEWTANYFATHRRELTKMEQELGIEKMVAAKIKRTGRSIDGQS